MVEVVHQVVTDLYLTVEMVALAEVVAAVMLGHQLVED